jgi:hypothetical protein
MIKAAGGTHWSSFWRELDAPKVREAQSLGLKVLAWTVNDRETMGQMLDLGVDGLVTDRPDIAIELLKARGIGWAFRSERHRMHCATVLQRTYWPAVPTCDRCRNCWVMPACRPRRSIRQLIRLCFWMSI